MQLAGRELFVATADSFSTELDQFSQIPQRNHYYSHLQAETNNLHELCHFIWFLVGLNLMNAEPKISPLRTYFFLG